MDYYRSPKHLKNIAEIGECFECGKTTQCQCAHSDQSICGKGMGIKSSDIFTFPLCPECHAIHHQKPFDWRKKELIYLGKVFIFLVNKGKIKIE